MKTLIVSYSGVYGILNRLLFLSTFCGYFFVSESKAQPITGPEMQWFQEQWYDMENVDQDDSGEDWFYDIKPYQEADETVGYITAGYVTIPNEFGDINCYGCGEGDELCPELEREGYQRGCAYPKIAEMDLKGNIEWYNIYTKGSGWFRQVIQLSDESGYVAIGLLKFDGANSITYYSEPGDEEGDYLPLCEVSGLYQLMYIVRTDPEGEIEAEAV